ncbi:MAG: PilZ domain-containing protein [Thermodesulfobacteriota bacterium]
MTTQELRREERLTIASIIFPFLGSRNRDFACFQYLPLDFSAHGLQIVIPRWVVNRERLLAGERINLHVPFKLKGDTYSQGEIAWAREDASVDGFRYGVQLTRKHLPSYPLYISLGLDKGVGVDLSDFETPELMLVQLIKDAALLKKGIQIYFDHLIPYFSRIADYPAELYPELKKLLFHDIGEKIRENHRRLEALHARLLADAWSHPGIPKDFDLEELRGFMESELSTDLLQLALGSSAITPYLSAIKELEKKQYTTYNAIVLLFVRSL